MALRRLYFPQIVGKINPGLRPTASEDRHLPCARFPGLTRKYSDAVNHTQTEELKEHEKERDFFCVVSDAFRVFARRSSVMLGSAWAFAGAMLVTLVWILTGPTFHFSDTWQLIINTGTTIVTFLMVFLIQNTQNRDARAIQLKLDELIRGLKGPRNKMVDLEDCSEEELAELEAEFKRIRARQQAHQHHPHEHKNH